MEPGSLEALQLPGLAFFTAKHLVLRELHPELLRFQAIVLNGFQDLVSQVRIGQLATGQIDINTHARELSSLPGFELFACGIDDPVTDTVYKSGFFSDRDKCRRGDKV